MKNPRVAPVSPWAGVPIVVKPARGSVFILAFPPGIDPEGNQDSTGNRVLIGDANGSVLEKVRDHFMICGYGQVGRTVVDQPDRLKIPFVLIETNEGLY
jgi:hypothetical protein